jgi:hypothetical protein
MIIVLKKNTTQEEFQEVIDMIKELGYQAHVIKGTDLFSRGRHGKQKRGQLH